MQAKFDHEKIARQRAEVKLLGVEKEKSELSVDLTQLQQQVGTLKSDLRMEIEKVGIIIYGSVMSGRSQYSSLFLCVLP